MRQLTHMQYENLALQHRGLLHKRLKDINTPVSEYSFANLYLFRRAHEYQVLFDKEIFIKGKTYDGHVHLTPTADLQQINADYLRDILKKEADFLYPIAEKWLSLLKSDEFEFTYNENDTDYIYTVEKMSTYKGNKLHNKRNLLMQFVTAYRHNVRPLMADTVG